MEIPLLKDILTIFGLSIAVLFICHRFRVPAIVGFLLTGVLAGPHGFGIVDAIHQVEVLAEIGIVLLLFSIGIEFSFGTLLQIGRNVLLGGFMQVSLTVLITFGAAWALGQTLGESVFMGFLISLSSTAIVLKIIQERAEMDSPYGRATLGILIFQDIIIVPMILVTPILAGVSGGQAGWDSLLFLLAKAIIIIALVIAGAKWIVPNLLYQVARTRNRELFLLSIVAIGLAVAWLTSSIGLSLALGAFLAGLIISESEYSHQALTNILPFRDVFTSFFFVSIGMLLDVRVLMQYPLLIAAATLAVIAVKALIGIFSGVLLGMSLRAAALAGIGLSQVGEFSFVLSKTGLSFGLLSGTVYQWFLGVSILSMAAAPFLMRMAPRVADAAMRLPLSTKIRLGRFFEQDNDNLGFKDHLVIIGYGLNGKNVARAASVADIPYLIIEMNPEIVKTERNSNNEPIFYGDAAQEAVLEHFNVSQARVAAVAISDPAATRRITELVRRLNPNVYLIIRTRYLQEVEPLYELGASEVIPEEFETSIEIFTRVLQKYLIPRQEVENFIADIRADGYEMLRTMSRQYSAHTDFKCHLPDVEMCSFRVHGQAAAAGKTLTDIGLRKKFGVTMLAIRRGTEIIYNPHGGVMLFSDDLAVLVGRREKMVEVKHLFGETGEDGDGCLGREGKR